MQFQVPQFIEVEDKIVGPFTIKQLVFLLGGAGGVYLIKQTVPGLLAWPLMLVLAVFTWALVFYKVNDRPFIITLQAAVKYYFAEKLYLWNKPEQRVFREIKKPGASIKESVVPTLSRNKLKELSWGLDINDTLK
ncbi:MAG: hypothetical protein COV10_03855 [Candidatus Vogelbacteria bacterium CG10_big_fil_rev_8_21_14_0_10_51_16]|uniref:PrgI family protein n=1 Tax=Candidatus Vogelbacteria bacterium CG10_big_fil_rev_8_21_14_0_10_51_16 TaxID=1975045 RepID=A0A2H0RDJ0_9BACT|nr:MAG: hypothetical protein COV10_03855 [Candidatus Vogelbacteria bacterium CG10_big_fil_rev_8_21_14_0_10_51_16]